MDIKSELTSKVTEIVKKISSDKTFKAKWDSNPASAIESVLGKDLPDDQINSVVTAVKAKLGADKLGSALGGILGKK